MHKTRLTLALLSCMAGVCLAQTESGKQFYRLDYAVKQVEDGKTVNMRHYSVTTDAGRSVIRTGSKLPLPTNDKGELTYIDVGVSIDSSNVHEKDGELLVDVTAEISNAVAGALKQPVIRQNKWSANVTVPMGKATTLFSSDDLASKGQVQLELTATPVK